MLDLVTEIIDYFTDCRVIFLPCKNIVHVIFKAFNWASNLGTYLVVTLFYAKCVLFKVANARLVPNNRSLPDLQLREKNIFKFTNFATLDGLHCSELRRK